MDKRLFTFLLFFTLFSSRLSAQYVTISDTAMVTWLTNNYPSAMTGNQMDTTDATITSAQMFEPDFLSGIQNLDGVQYFDGAGTLNIDIPTLVMIPSFPQNAHTIILNNSLVQSMPNLPSSLVYLFVSNNLILQSLPVLPSSLQTLFCGLNSFTSFPNLPSSLTTLGCAQSNLTYLPNLPNNLKWLNCSFNNLTSLPTLPDSLLELDCSLNNLTSLPQLPPSVIFINVNDNPNLTCLPILPDGVLGVDIISTNISCIPNIPPQAIFSFSVTPTICLPNNPNGCYTSGFVSGAVFFDANGSCINNGNLSSNGSFQLFDNQNNFLQSNSLSSDSNFYFSHQGGNFFVRMDTSFSTNSVSLSCPSTGEHLVTALQDSIYVGLDFGLNCIGEDLGVEAIVPEGIVFPGQAHSVKAILGDLSHYLGLNCASGTGGTVQINITGPISYSGYPTTALAPIVNGNSYSYTITDFGAISLDESFILNFLTDTTAQAGNSILVTATITSDSLDLDSTNNSLSYTYFVVNSYDPNMKEVNPVNVLPGYEDYFTYTVHFQNLGSAPAFNIRIKDTIDGNLNLQTLRVINASHDYYYNLSGDLLTVHFPNIMLADSASNPEGSKGFIQYQVKAKPNLPLGTIIENTAHIYFDFNPAVVTNTTTNTYVETLSLAEKDQEEFFVYPNPSSGQFTIVGQNIKNEPVKVQVCDLTGKVWKTENLNFKNGSASMQTDLASGSYILIFETASGRTIAHRLMIRN